MLARSHILCAIAGLIAVHAATGAAPSAIEVGVYLVGSIAPDIDGDGVITRPGRYIPTRLGRLLHTPVDVLSRGCARIIQFFVSHRGLCHWPVIAAALFAAGLQFQSLYLTWFAAGYSIHLACDFITVGGIPLFAPLSYRRRSLGLLRTGSLMEALFSLAMLGIAIYYAA